MARNETTAPVTKIEPEASVPGLPNQARGYLDEVLKFADEREQAVVSVILFGSARKGGFSQGVSDVDLIVVLADEVSRKMKRRLKGDLAALELKHKLRERPKSRIEIIRMWVDKIAGQFKSQFICYRRDFLSGNTAAAFGINPFLESLILSTHIAFASIVTSAKTIWGEDLLRDAHLPVLTKGHLAKNYIGFFMLNAGALLAFPLIPNATKYSMSAFKWMIHCCHFCSTLKSARLEEEVEFFRGQVEEDACLTELLSLRQEYRPSLRFVWNCFRVIRELYILTVRVSKFPISVRGRHIES
ncbi:MAG TPA: nucleotidyltransferase domain-containing protein [Pyrinomonadaceae bacterium]|nr:nucleotidyltransferase domain-containing protein [Pyrinomonadaceae bacterium]